MTGAARRLRRHRQAFHPETLELLVEACDPDNPSNTGHIVFVDGPAEWQPYPEAARGISPWGARTGPTLPCVFDSALDFPLNPNPNLTPDLPLTGPCTG